MLRECVTLLCSVSLQRDVTDYWRWELDPAEGYTVRGAYHLLAAQDTSLVDNTTELIWHKQVPLEVSVFAWRLLRDRLPTRSNLLNCGIITGDAASCMAGCPNLETSQHLFLSCGFHCSLWQVVRSWLGVSGPDPHSISEQFYQFIHSADGLRSRRSFLQLVWLLCVWTIWNDRNNRLFNNVEKFIDHLLEKVKHTSLWWLKTSQANFVYGFSSWWSIPLICLGIS
jgi:hypothetical protein